MNKERAIDRANHLSEQHKEKFYVIHQPTDYKEIMGNVGYKVVNKITDENRASVVYETN